MQWLARISGTRAWYIFRNDGARLRARVMRILSCPAFEPLRLSRLEADSTVRRERPANAIANDEENIRGSSRAAMFSQATRSQCAVAACPRERKRERVRVIAQWPARTAKERANETAHAEFCRNRDTRSSSRPKTAASTTEGDAPPLK
jgi:hypothetical protein